MPKLLYHLEYYLIFKLDKKRETKLIKALTRICEDAKRCYEGFVWLTHIVDERQPQSPITIIFVFETKVDIELFSDSSGKQALETTLRMTLKKLGIPVANMAKNIVLDCEEKGASQRWL